MKGNWAPDWIWKKMKENLLLTPIGFNESYWCMSTSYGQMELARNFENETCRRKLFTILKALSKLCWGEGKMKSGLTSYILLV